MDPSRLIRRAECEWELPQTGAMRVPGLIYADEPLIRAMDEKVSERLQRLAMTPTRMRRLRVNLASDLEMRWLLEALNREGRKLGTQVERRADGVMLLRWS